VAPPAWPAPPQGWVPPPGWQPDLAWGPAPAGWQFWVIDGVDRGAVPAVPPASVVPPTEVSGEDGRIALVGDHLLLNFADKFTTNALKKAVGVRSYPLAAVADIHINPDGYRGHPTLRVVVQPGADLLRPLLKDYQPDPGGDPDTLVLGKGGTVAQAEAFATGIRARMTAGGVPGPGPVLVDSGRLPMTVAGAGTTATFDGAVVLLQVSSRSASAVKKNSYPRRIPAGAIADVVIGHPKLTGALRFLLAGGPGRDAAVDPRTDVDTVELRADTGQSYVVFAAAVLTAGRRVGVTVHPELLPHTPAPVQVLQAPQPLRAAVPPSLPVQPTPAPRVASPALAQTATTVQPVAETVPPPPVRPTPEVRVALPTPTHTVAASGMDQGAQPEAAEPGVAQSTSVSKPGWRERRADKREVKQHAAAVAAWEVDQARLDKLASAAQAATGRGGGVDAGIMLKAGEVALWSGAASLVEPRRQQGHYSGAYSGVSFRVAKGVRYTVGGSRGHYVPGPEVQTPIDSGRAVVTTGRVVFAGGKATREWAFSKLVSMDSSADDATVLISVSNRQKVSGVHLGKSGTEFTHFLALGVAVTQSGALEVAAECRQSADAHRATRP
jgi:hypothetical protein